MSKWKQTETSLYKKFEFKDFKEAINFINKVAQCADKLNHHPTITNSYNIVELELSTHSADGKVTNKDHELAEAIDKLNNQAPATDTNNQKSLASEETSSVKLAKAKLFTDGGSRGNPGPSALGYVILDMNDGIIKKESDYLGVTTNNQAEYRALIAGMADALAMGVKDIDIYMDSQLVVNQVKGEWKVKHAEIQPVNAEAKNLFAKFEKATISYVPRAMNSIADGMVNECLDSQ